MSVFVLSPAFTDEGVALPFGVVDMSLGFTCGVVVLVVPEDSLD